MSDIISDMQWYRFPYSTKEYCPIPYNCQRIGTVWWWPHLFLIQTWPELINHPFYNNGITAKDLPKYTSATFELRVLIFWLQPGCWQPLSTKSIVPWGQSMILLTENRQFWAKYWPSWPIIGHFYNTLGIFSQNVWPIGSMVPRKTR